jgi:hypothetical protein
LQPSAAQVWDFVLDRADGPSSLAASLSPTAELLEGHIDTMTTNRVHWGTRFALVAALLHFPELEAELELLRSVRNVDLMEDQWKPSGPKRAWCQTHWCHTSFLQLPTALLMFQG